MSNAPLYNIPASQIEAYRGRNLIIRSASPAEIVDCLLCVDPATVRFVQLISSPADTSVLEGIAENLPIEILLNEPAEYNRLYNYSNLLDSHPVRITIPVVPGFSKAAKLAVSLNFTVKLAMDQPDNALVDEVLSVLDLYLHSTHVRQPIEFFHTLLLSFYEGKAVSLWEIVEEDPKQVRYVTNDGRETISDRFAGRKLEYGLDNFIEQFRQKVLSDKRECDGCEFFNRCGGYFKLPDEDFRCDGVKKIFGTLQKASADLQQDVESCVVGVQAQS